MTLLPDRVFATSEVIPTPVLPLPGLRIFKAQSWQLIKGAIKIMSLLKSGSQDMLSTLWIEMEHGSTSLFLLRTVISHKSSSPPSYQANSWKLFAMLSLARTPYQALNLVCTTALNE